MADEPELADTRSDAPPTRPDPSPGSPAADPWPHSEPTLRPARRAAGRVPRRWWFGGGAVTAACAVAAFLVVLLWPAGAVAPPAFRPLEPVATVATGDAEGVWARIHGDELFLAARQGAATLAVGADLATGAVAWERTVPDLGDVATLAVMGGSVLLYGDAIGDTPRSLVGLDQATGEERWRRTFHGDDSWFLAGEAVTLADRAEGALRGLDPATGRELWTRRFPEGGAVAVVPVVTGPDLAARSRLRSTHDVPRADGRVVLVGTDRSATVVDSRTGAVVGNGVNIAAPGDLLVAYHERLYVAERQDGYRIYAYDLADLAGQPDILYRAPAAGRTPVSLAPCGDGLVCVLEEGGDQPEVVALDSGGGEAWRHPAPAAEYLLPVGEFMVVGGDQPAVVVYDRDGQEVLSRPGVAVRLDAASLLLFASDPGTTWSEASVAGIGLTDGAAQREELGQVDAVRAAGCAWDTRYLACPTQAGAAVWSFADP